jgi:hypothetical protein
MKEFIKSAENRAGWLQKGYEDAKLFLLERDHDQKSTI